MSRVVADTIDKISASEGLQKAQIVLDDVLEIDALARVRADEVIRNIG